MKPLALRAQESSACLGGHSKFNTEILARNTAKQTYGQSTHRGEVSIRRSNWSHPTLQGPGLRFLPFPPPPVRPCIQQYSWVRLPFPQVGPWVRLPPPFFSRLFHSSLLFPPFPTLPHPPPGVCLFLPFAVLLQLSRCWLVLLCCVFCFVLLLFCLPGLGSVCFLLLPSPLFLPLVCLLVVCCAWLFKSTDLWGLMYFRLPELCTVGFLMEWC